MNVIIFSSTLVLIESAQAVLLAGRLMALKPVAIFFLFLFLALAGEAAALRFLAGPWGRPASRKILKSYLGLEAVLLGLLLAASYKLVIYDYSPGLAGGAFNVLLAASVLSKIFFKQVRDFILSVRAFLTYPANAPALRLLADTAFVVFIVLFIYVPDPHAVIARMFVGEQFHHWDLFMLPAWANLKGCISYVDVISEYGVGIPIVMGLGSRLFGGFGYENVFQLLVILTIIYYAATYIFLRSWLKSVPIVIIAMLMGLKTQMFHTGVSPFVFTYPSSTVVRNFFDVFFFLCIWRHLLGGKSLFLWAAAVLCSLAEFNLIDTGVYLIAAFYIYLFLICILPDLRGRLARNRRERLHIAGCFFFVPLLFILLLTAVAGGHVFTRMYWYNMADYIIYFLSGPGLIPYSESLHYHYFWAAAMGFAIPVVYLASILVLGLLCYWRKAHSPQVLVIVLCVYGLGLYHYYAARTAVTSYYVSGLPFIFVVCFWLQKICEGVNARMRANTLLAIMVFCWFCLWTNHQVLAYPNMFNFSRNPMVDPLVTLPFPDQRGYFNHQLLNYGPDYRLPLNSLGETDEKLVTQRDFKSNEELKAFYDKEFDFGIDARLIASLTPPDGKAAVLSSFEFRLLMQSDRKPFFYFSPFLAARPMRMRTYPLEGVFSAAYLTKTLRQFEDEKPEYIFMERIFLETNVPAAYKDDMPRLLSLLDYIRSSYAPYKFGEYLVAMKRRSAHD
jgi:hypothetical protein